MTSLAIEAFGVPSGTRDARVLAYTEERAVDELRGRCVWCAAGLAGSRKAARAILEHLGPLGGDGVESEELAVSASDQMLWMARRLAGMLHGEWPAENLGPEDRQLCSEGRERGEEHLARVVQPDDVVVLLDPLAALLAETVRARGAHAVWYVEPAPRSEGAARRHARSFLDDYTAAAVDAYITAWRDSPGEAVAVGHIRALIPAADVVAEKEIDLLPAADLERRRDAGWFTALADVVSADRDETVGGMLHARPAVAAR